MAVLAARSMSASRKLRRYSPRSFSSSASGKRNAAFALAELLSRRGPERPYETLVAWAREA
jgi:hypothetical protein